MEISESFIKSFRQKKFDSIKWTKEEKAVKSSRKYREEVFPKYILTFSNALLLALRKSVFGCYVNVLNPQQHQDKNLNENKLPITEYIIKNLSDREIKTFQENNKLFEDSINALKSIIKEKESVELEYLTESMKTLRLTDFYINKIDPLKTFSDLQVLILTGNNITYIEGGFLPRNLVFLELYDNFIDNFRNFVKKAPKKILHLGFGRNRLDDNSFSHLPAKSNNFPKLLSLDISDNDIYNLNAVLQELRGLQCLRSLQLEGNPCNVEPEYKETVLKYFPNLLYLDNVEITKEDRIVDENPGVEGRKPQIVFYCHRIMGLRHPPRDAKNIQTIHIEFELPLLEAVHEEKPTKEKSVGTPEKSTKKTQTLKKEKADKNKSKANKSSKKSKSAKQKSPYDSPNEYDAYAEQNNFSFKTARMPWNAVMEFSPVFIESPERDTRAIRDTFRSTVTVRVIYLKIARPKKGKTKKAKKTPKAKKSKLKSTIQADVPVEEPKEIIVKRVTLCSFNCELKYLNWSDETIDFHWADHPKISADAIRMDGCLKNIAYSKSAKKKKTKGMKNEEAQNTANPTYPIPKIFTCQVGFGLKRS